MSKLTCSPAGKRERLTQSVMSMRDNDRPSGNDLRRVQPLAINRPTRARASLPAEQGGAAPHVEVADIEAAGQPPQSRAASQDERTAGWRAWGQLMPADPEAGRKLDQFAAIRQVEPGRDTKVIRQGANTGSAEIQGVAFQSGRNRRDPRAIGQAQEVDPDVAWQACQASAASKNQLVDVEAIRQLGELLDAAEVKPIAQLEVRMRIAREPQLARLQAGVDDALIIGEEVHGHCP